MALRDAKLHAEAGIMRGAQVAPSTFAFNASNATTPTVSFSGAPSSATYTSAVVIPS